MDRHVGGRFRALRKERAMSRTELGRHLGVSSAQIHKYERGADRVDAARLFATARLFGVAVSVFFDDLRFKRCRLRA